jgi:hypothetical protein
MSVILLEMGSLGKVLEHTNLKIKANVRKIQVEVF